LCARRFLAVALYLTTASLSPPCGSGLPLVSRSSWPCGIAIETGRTRARKRRLRRSWRSGVPPADGHGSDGSGAPRCGSAHVPGASRARPVDGHRSAWRLSATTKSARNILSRALSHAPEASLLKLKSPNALTLHLAEDNHATHRSGRLQASFRAVCCIALMNSRLRTPTN